MGWSWSQLRQSPGGKANAMWLMQDGSVLANLNGSTQLMALHPDGQGSYVNGSWKPAGNFLLIKNAFASAVLSDGRLITCGGENTGPNYSTKSETNFCEIYDPGTQSSTQLAPPPGWPSIGDSPSVVLNDGTFLLGNTQGMGQQVALLDPATLTWTFGGGDADNEQGYTLMQTGDVLTTGVYAPTSMRYDPGVNKFGQDAPLPVMLGANLIVGGQPSGETGPGITLMDGRVIWFGATGHTCIYTPGGEGNNGTWVQGPDLPTASGSQLIAADVPAILEPNGKVLLAVGGPGFPTTLLEYDPVLNAFSLVDNAPPDASQGCALLLLPNGHGLVSFGSGNWYDVTFTPGGDPSWAPTIISFPTMVVGNSTVTLRGTQLCGLSECYSYGDDSQQAENYPMVGFVDSQGGVTYARAHDVSTRSIAPGEPGTVLVDIPASLVPATDTPATYSVEVVAMGIPSRPVTVNVMPQGWINSQVTPVISSISPSTGSTLGGTEVMIQGSGFDSRAMEIFFGGPPAAEIFFPDPTDSGHCMAWSPPASAGPVNITARTYGVLRSSPSPADVFTYAYLPSVASITASPNVLWTGRTLLGTVTLNEPAASGGTTVTLTLSGPAGVTVPTAVEFAAGGTSADFTITAAATATSGTATITATGPDGTPQSTTIAIYPGQIFISVPSLFDQFPSSLGYGQPVTGTILVRTPAPAAGGLITLSTNRPDAVRIPANVDLPGGSTTSVPFTLAAFNVHATGVTISASYEGDSTTSAAFRVNVQIPPPPPRGPFPI